MFKDEGKTVLDYDGPRETDGIVDYVKGAQARARAPGSPIGSRERERERETARRGRTRSHEAGWSG